jgi:hypothetical protein
MNERTVQLFQLTVQDLTDLISGCLASEIEKLGKVLQINPVNPQKELLTREEVSKLLKLSYTTLWKHDKTGILPAKKTRAQGILLKS